MITTDRDEGQAALVKSNDVMSVRSDEKETVVTCMKRK